MCSWVIGSLPGLTIKALAPAREHGVLPARAAPAVCSALIVFLPRDARLGHASRVEDGIQLLGR